MTGQGRVQISKIITHDCRNESKLNLDTTALGKHQENVHTVDDAVVNYVASSCVA